MLLLHCDVLHDLLYKHTATWNLFVLDGKNAKVVNGDVFHASVLREMIIKYQSKSVHNSANDKCRENIKIYSRCHFD